MRKVYRPLFTGIAVSAIIVGTACGADYSSMSTDELSQIRGTLQDASQEERDAFRSEWAKRLDSMSPSERAEYAASGPGKGYGLKDGSGSGGGGVRDGSGSGNGPQGGKGNGGHGNGGGGKGSGGGGKGNGGGGGKGKR